MVSKTDNARLQRIESKAPGQIALPVIVRSKDESREAFEARADEHYKKGWGAVVMLPAKAPIT